MKIYKHTHTQTHVVGTWMGQSENFSAPSYITFPLITFLYCYKKLLRYSLAKCCLTWNWIGSWFVSLNFAMIKKFHFLTFSYNYWIIRDQTASLNTWKKWKSSVFQLKTCYLQWCYCVLCIFCSLNRRYYFQSIPCIDMHLWRYENVIKCRDISYLCICKYKKQT